MKVIKMDCNKFFFQDKCAIMCPFVDMIRIFKQSRHDFSGQHLCDGYCMDIM